MEEVFLNSLLKVTQEERAMVQKFYDINDPSKLLECFDAIDEWCKKQDHLIEAYQYIDRNVVERLYLAARGSIELTKIKIDKLLTTRGMLSDLVLNRSYDEFHKCWDHFYFIPLPSLNSADGTRCTVGKMIQENYDEVSVVTLLRFFVLIGEMRLFCDYMQGDKYIWDLGNISMSILTKLNPFLLKKIETLIVGAYDIKIKGIYFINSPPFIDNLISLFKPFLGSKLISRIKIISSYEELYKEVSKEILPEDYGGDAPSLSKLSDQWKDCLKTERSLKLINDLNKAASDESKRNSFKFNEEYLGMPGSFRSLIVD